MNLTLFTSSPCAGAPALLVEKGPAPNPHRDYGGYTKSEQKYSVQSTEYSTFIGTTNIKHGTLYTVELLAYAIEESGPSVEGGVTLSLSLTFSSEISVCVTSTCGDGVELSLPLYSITVVEILP